VPQAPLSYYWHDYETFGLDPQRDRPAQFAGQRTDADCKPIGEPLLLYCRPADDYLPDPGACAITGISPQRALAEGVTEAEFTRRIHNELSVPGTCALGYNSLRFDDEFTRNLLYRNFFDPYAREWRDGNSRWDLIDVVRLARALRPQGIEWPLDDEGRPSNRLELLTAANGIDHGQAHDALADVRATIAIARLLRQRQPRLFNFAREHRDKRSAAGLLDLRRREALLHVSGRIHSRHANATLVMPLCRHPDNPNGVIVYDLREDPAPLLSLSAEQLRERVFTSAEALPAGVARVPLKTVHINKCPVLAPLKVLDAASRERIGIDVDAALTHREAILAAADPAPQVRAAFAARDLPPISDPDRMLYAGGFFSDADRQRMTELRSLAPQALGDAPLVFDDPRVGEMLLRYRGRNYPETLRGDEAARWAEYRRARLLEGADGARSLAAFRAALESTELPAELAAELGDYADALEAGLH